jgi:UDP-GlcNAc:undecaprenyl-phosphate/decaprenyl-phosphate GlcNAc-1-phosphate transferase
LTNIEVIVLACGSSAALAALLAHYAERLRLLDLPGGHKHHVRPVPVVGGIAIATAILMVALWQWCSDTITAADGYVLIAASMMLGLGLWDDRHDLTPRSRFVGQAMAALLMAGFGGALLRNLGALIDGENLLVLGWLAWPMTVFSIVGVMNACNMSDGMDGSAGTLALLAVVGAQWLALDQGAGSVLLIALASALLGFLVWNAPLWRSARVYLGDGGSLFIGSLLAWMLVSMSQGEHRAFAPAAALWLYALPLIDTVSVMWRRVAEGRSPFQPDQRHIHHVLLRAGFVVRNAWLLILAVAAVGVMVAILATRYSWSEPALAGFFLLVAMGHHVTMRAADRSGRYLGKTLAPNVAAAAVPGITSP